jgi:hypothetical protein
MRHWHWFQFVSNGILALFLGIMVYVICIAYMRHSGSTGLDMTAIQKMRYDAASAFTPSVSPSSALDP